MSSRLGLRYREGFVKSRYICFFFNNPAPTELYTLSLHDAQPSLSQHIRALEDKLSGAVVTRFPHGAALTPAGRSLLPEAGAALRAVERAYRAPRAALALEAGELEIATVLSMAVGLLPRYIGAWHRQYPEVAIRLHEFRHRTLLEDSVEQGVADLAIGPHPVRPWSGPLEII